MEESDSNPRWVEYIRSRIERAKQWREEMPVHEDLAKKHRYVRILGKSFRAISISPQNPCGRLIAKDGNKPVEGKTSLKAAIKSAFNAEDYAPNTEKKELEIQAFLIRHALMNGQKLHGMLKGFDEAFEELIFATDELSTGKLRADIIALGRKGDLYFPVFIELKKERLLTRLEEQLKAAKEFMEMSFAKPHFIAMLSAVSGISEAKISFDDCRLMVVWPPSISGQEDGRVETARSKDGILFSEFCKKGDEFVFVRN